ncbi:basic proline-rich protein-like [Indicator indicator]|uniref:basic proline-rich protein-like n=1 Tax=Indicator indicator TaxID=1002788 RepID=UPI0023DF8648|nr:basic proline-rich protein-like [Indicator indicator]
MPLYARPAFPPPLRGIPGAVVSLPPACARGYGFPSLPRVGGTPSCPGAVLRSSCVSRCRSPRSRVSPGCAGRLRLGRPRLPAAGPLACPLPVPSPYSRCCPLGPGRRACTPRPARRASARVGPPRPLRRLAEDLISPAATHRGRCRPSAPRPPARAVLVSGLPPRRLAYPPPASFVAPPLPGLASRMARRRRRSPQPRARRLRPYPGPWPARLPHLRAGPCTAHPRRFGPRQARGAPPHAPGAAPRAPSGPPVRRPCATGWSRVAGGVGGSSPAALTPRAPRAPGAPRAGGGCGLRARAGPPVARPPGRPRGPRASPGVVPGFSHLPPWGPFALARAGAGAGPRGRAARGAPPGGCLLASWPTVSPSCGPVGGGALPRLLVGSPLAYGGSLPRVRPVRLLPGPGRCPPSPPPSALVPCAPRPTAPSPSPSAAPPYRGRGLASPALDAPGGTASGAPRSSRGRPLPAPPQPIPPPLLPPPPVAAPRARAGRARRRYWASPPPAGLPFACAPRGVALPSPPTRRPRRRPLPRSSPVPEPRFVGSGTSPASGRAWRTPRRGVARFAGLRLPRCHVPPPPRARLRPPTLVARGRPYCVRGPASSLRPRAVVGSPRGLVRPCPLRSPPVSPALPRQLWAPRPTGTSPGRGLSWGLACRLPGLLGSLRGSSRRRSPPRGGAVAAPWAGRAAVTRCFPQPARGVGPYLSGAPQCWVARPPALPVPPPSGSAGAPGGARRGRSRRRGVEPPPSRFSRGLRPRRSRRPPAPAEPCILPPLRASGYLPGPDGGRGGPAPVRLPPPPRRSRRRRWAWCWGRALPADPASVGAWRAPLSPCAPPAPSSTLAPRGRLAPAAPLLSGRPAAPPPAAPPRPAGPASGRGPAPPCGAVCGRAPGGPVAAAEGHRHSRKPWGPRPPPPRPKPSPRTSHPSLDPCCRRSARLPLGRRAARGSGSGGGASPLGGGEPGPPPHPTRRRPRGCGAARRGLTARWLRPPPPTPRSIPAGPPCLPPPAGHGRSAAPPPGPPCPVAAWPCPGPRWASPPSPALTHSGAALAAGGGMA